MNAFLSSFLQLPLLFAFDSEMERQNERATSKRVFVCLGGEMEPILSLLRFRHAFPSRQGIHQTKSNDCEVQEVCTYISSRGETHSCPCPCTRHSYHTNLTLGSVMMNRRRGCRTLATKTRITSSVLLSLPLSTSSTLYSHTNKLVRKRKRLSDNKGNQSESKPSPARITKSIFAFTKITTFLLACPAAHSLSYTFAPNFAEKLLALQ